MFFIAGYLTNKELNLIINNINIELLNIQQIYNIYEKTDITCHSIVHTQL